MNNIEIILRTKPVPMSRPRIVSRGGRTWSYYPHKIEKALKDTTNLIRQYKIKNNIKTIHDPVKAEIVVKLLRPRSAARRQYPNVRPDLDNFIKLITDAVVGAGLLDDDSQIIELAAKKCYSDEDGWEIKISSFNLSE
jgi:Holliday junction resolvase RusA-like endonuclease